MVSPRRPLPRPEPQPQLRPAVPPSQPQPEISIAPERFFKRRTLVYTGAVAIIVIAGSILGSQLKSRKQAQERREALLALEASESQEQISTAANGVPDKSKDHTPAIKPSTVSPPSDLQRQIAFLEDRRGRLIGQKISLEQKLASVREKMKKEEELNASRSRVEQVER